MNLETFSIKRKTARVAGFWYFLMLISGPVGLMYVPSKIIVAGDASATANNIVSHDFLLRAGIVSNLICQIAFVFLVMVLYKLLKEVNITRAKLMVALVLVAVPIAILNEIFQIAALLLKSDSSYLSAFDKNQLDSFSLLSLTIYEQGTHVAGIFWGLWLLPFGMLVVKSGFIPKIIGVFLVIGCFSYLINSATVLLLPQYKGIVADILMVPLAIGEFPAVFWLLIKGVKSK